MIYAVIDTNVLVSALITHDPEAATTKVVRHLLERNFIPMYDEDVIAEYADVLQRQYIFQQLNNPPLLNKTSADC